MTSKKGKLKDIEVLDIHDRKIMFPRFLYVVKVIWSNGSQNIIHRKYSGFILLQTTLLEHFPSAFGRNGRENCRIPLLPVEPVQCHICTLKEAVQRLDILYKFCKNLLSLPDFILQNDRIKSFFLPMMSDVKRQRQSNTVTISPPIPTEEYQAKASYEKTNTNEISLKADETVAVLEKSETGWWKVFGDNGIGWVPRSYLVSLRDEPRRINQDHDCCTYIAVNDYKAQRMDELDIDEGFVMTVIERNDNGWWKVRFKNKEGLVPRTCITPLDSLDGKNMLNSVFISIQREAALENEKPQLRNNQNITKSISKRRSRNKPAPLPPMSEKYEARKSHLDVSVVSLVSDADQITEGTIVNNSNNIRQFSHDMVPLPSPHRLSRGSTRKMSGPRLFRSPSFHDDYLSRQLESQEYYRTIGAFSSTVCDGLSFTEGQILKISRKTLSGWWYAHFMEKKGWVPASYLINVDDVCCYFAL